MDGSAAAHPGLAAGVAHRAAQGAGAGRHAFSAAVHAAPGHAGTRLGALTPPPMEQCWDALVRVVQRMPLPQQIDLARDIAPLASSRSALNWSTEVATQAPHRYKAAMLIQVARRGTEWGSVTQAVVWHAVLRAALPLPPMPRAEVLRLSRQNQPSDGCPGWSPSEDKALLETP